VMVSGTVPAGAAGSVMDDRSQARAKQMLADLI
jgi:hypothetical protein